ncbi:MAG: CGNR zinc finger domain-containing protein, partial [Streptosporangiaceae bacterium]|nr:CGNR zinc finger domain-containing protein [Streptosporangiaceae bacterium]
MNFNSHMDVVIRVAVDLVNLLTPGQDRGRRYVPPEGDERTAAVGAVLRAAGRREATWEEAAGLRLVAAELRGVFEAVTAGAVDDAARQVNALLIRTGA